MAVKIKPWVAFSFCGSCDVVVRHVCLILDEKSVSSYETDVNVLCPLCVRWVHVKFLAIAATKRDISPQPDWDNFKILMPSRKYIDRNLGLVSSPENQDLSQRKLETDLPWWVKTCCNPILVNQLSFRWNWSCSRGVHSKLYYRGCVDVFHVILKSRHVIVAIVTVFCLGDKLRLVWRVDLYLRSFVVCFFFYLEYA